MLNTCIQAIGIFAQMNCCIMAATLSLIDFVTVGSNVIPHHSNELTCISRSKIPCQLQGLTPLQCGNGANNSKLIISIVTPHILSDRLENNRSLLN
jgi:hypothetical protein